MPGKKRAQRILTRRRVLVVVSMVIFSTFVFLMSWTVKNQSPRATLFSDIAITETSSSIEGSSGERSMKGRFLYQPTGKHGLGHTLAEYNWGLLEASKHNLTKVHIPLICAHGPENECEVFFGLGIGAKATDEEISRAVDWQELRSVAINGSATPEKLAAFVVEHPEDNVVFNFTEARSSSDYSTTRAWWKGQLSKAKQEPLWHEMFPGPGFNASTINVALHIRRGDLMKSFGVKGKEKLIQIRYTANEFYINVFRTIQRAFPPNTVVGYFVSQGDPKDFEDIAEAFPNDHIIANGKVLDDFRLLMESDILVTAKSGFSHLAAVLSDSMIIALPFWSSYDYLPSVIEADEDRKEGFDLPQFVKVWNQRTKQQRKGIRADLGLKDEFLDPLS